MTRKFIEQHFKLFAFSAVQGAQHPRLALLEHRHKLSTHSASFACYQQQLPALVGRVGTPPQKSLLFKVHDSSCDVRLQMPRKLNNLGSRYLIFEPQKYQDQDLRTLYSELLLNGPKRGFPVEVLYIAHFESCLNLNFIHYIAHL
jgi:hypothetical protein